MAGVAGASRGAGRLAGQAGRLFKRRAVSLRRPGSRIAQRASTGSGAGDGRSPRSESVLFSGARSVGPANGVTPMRRPSALCSSPAARAGSRRDFIGACALDTDLSDGLQIDPQGYGEPDDRGRRGHPQAGAHDLRERGDGRVMADRTVSAKRPGFDELAVWTRRPGSRSSSGSKGPAAPAPGSVSAARRPASGRRARNDGDGPSDPWRAIATGSTRAGSQAGARRRRTLDRTARRRAAGTAARCSSPIAASSPAHAADQRPAGAAHDRPYAIRALPDGGRRQATRHARC